MIRFISEENLLCRSPSMGDVDMIYIARFLLILLKPVESKLYRRRFGGRDPGSHPDITRILRRPYNVPSCTLIYYHILSRAIKRNHVSLRLITYHHVLSCHHEMVYISLQNLAAISRFLGCPPPETRREDQQAPNFCRSGVESAQEAIADLAEDYAPSVRIFIRIVWRAPRPHRPGALLLGRHRSRRRLCDLSDHGSRGFLALSFPHLPLLPLVLLLYRLDNLFVGLHRQRPDVIFSLSDIFSERTGGQATRRNLRHSPDYV